MAPYLKSLLICWIDLTRRVLLNMRVAIFDIYSSTISIGVTIKCPQINTGGNRRIIATAIDNPCVIK